MAINPMSALNAYSAASAAATGGAGGSLMPNGARAAGGPSAIGDFASLLENSVAGAEMQLGRAETLSAQAAMGQAELVDVVTAISAAEASLETMLAVRDEVIRAYQDIMKMPI